MLPGHYQGHAVADEKAWNHTMQDSPPVRIMRYNTLMPHSDDGWTQLQLRTLDMGSVSVCHDHRIIRPLRALTWSSNDPADARISYGISYRFNRRSMSSMFSKRRPALARL